MEVEQSFNVEQKDSKIVMETNVTKIFDVKEAMAELQKLKQETMQYGKQVETLRKQIEDGQHSKDLEKMEGQLDKLQKLEAEWVNMIAPTLEALRKEAKMKIKTKKAEMGWKRISNADDRVVKSAKILGEVALDLDIDVAHPVICECRVGFDKI